MTMKEWLRQHAEHVDDYSDPGILVPRIDKSERPQLRRNLSTVELRILAKTHEVPEIRYMASELLRERGLSV